MDADKAIPLGILVTGAYLAWFGVHYWRSDVTWPSDPVKAVLTGRSLPDNSRNDTSEVTGSFEKIAGSAIGAANAVNGASGAGGVGQLIATTAMKYVGQGYVYGGNASKLGDWDCSSFVSKVLGQDLGFPLPGGHWGDPGFPPHSHGPTTLNYMTFGTGIDLKDVQAGDLIVSVEHIAIAISPTQMVSAQDEQLGVGTSTFPAGFPSGPPIYRRVTQLAPAALGAGAAAGGAAGGAGAGAGG